MVDRIQLRDTVYMQLDTQWQVVPPGTVVDVPDAGKFSGKHITVLSPTEAAGTLPVHGKAATVRPPQGRR